MGTDTIELSTENFKQEVLTSDLPIVAYFWAQWCSLCTTLSPVLDELAAEYRGKIKIGRIDIDAHRMLTNEHRIQDTPTLIFFHKGHVLRRLTGEASRSRLEEMFEHMAEVAAEHC
jgi:thioredoxin 1